MKKLPILLLFVGCLHHPCFSQSLYWQQTANFRINVTLHDEDNSLEGFEQILYVNHSPDTLHFIWFHVWPNAYKNDRTAFSEQLLKNGRTDYYFAKKEQHGYINQLDFKVNGATARTEDHPQYIDILKVLLPAGLAPGDSATISTPFHVKLPYLFSRSGYSGKAYQVTQWFPKPAVYDLHGWHQMPYLDQGEFYSEFGSYDVRITVPSNYVVAATGALQDSSEISWLNGRKHIIPVLTESVVPKIPVRKPGPYRKKTAAPKVMPAVKPPVAAIVPDTKPKTLHFLAENIHDFAWFADRNFVVSQDSLQLPSGRAVKVIAYYHSADQHWKNVTLFAKRAVQFRSALLGEYPYPVVQVVEGADGGSDGMEYPTITVIRGLATEKELDLTIEHEVGHNWFYGVIASNERDYPWMDEGLNTYYDRRYMQMVYGDTALSLYNAGGRKTSLVKRLPVNEPDMLLNAFAAVSKDQSFALPSEQYPDLNYNVDVYLKTAAWLQQFEQHTGRAKFDVAMQLYFQRFTFRHPYPRDFRQVLEEAMPGQTDTSFATMSATGSLNPYPKKQRIVPTLFFNLHDTRHIQYLSVSPFIGINTYDGVMPGLVIHNYQLPAKKLRFILAPLYGTRSKKFAGLSRLSYRWFPGANFYAVEIGTSAAHFQQAEYNDGVSPVQTLGYTKLAPFLRFTLPQRNPLSKQEKYLQLKSFFISEDEIVNKEVINGSDTSVVTQKTNASYYLNQLKFVIANRRALYPYYADLTIEQGIDFVRAGFTGKYFFNYANKQGGMQVRVFGGKFMYLGAATISKQFSTDRFHLNLSGANGFEDYTYSNYFAGRNKFDGFASQQLMVRDGAFKVRTDLLNDKYGKTDRWLAATNLTSDIPAKINPLSMLPFKIPLKAFLDIGTVAENWDKDAAGGKFVYDAGLQIPLLHETVNIYLPLFYSNVFRDYYKSILGKNHFFKTVSFSIDLQSFDLKRPELLRLF